jgi:hypothetical protein
LAFACTATLSFADGPSWWTNRNVHQVSGPVVTNDFAAVNMGQLKWIATNAYDEIASVFGTNAVTNVTALLRSWLPGVSNYTAVNIGQVKYVTSFIYDSLIANQYADAYPWTATVTDDADFAMANIGQVKELYKFDLRIDGDGDGLANWKENGTGVYISPSRTGSSPVNSDSDNDGIFDGTEVAARTDPNNPDRTKPTPYLTSPIPDTPIMWMP